MVGIPALFCILPAILSFKYPKLVEIIGPLFVFISFSSIIYCNEFREQEKPDRKNNTKDDTDDPSIESLEDDEAGRILQITD